MIINNSNINRNFKTIGVSSFWSNCVEKELKMHKIHSYPAKFPSLLVNKSLEYAKNRNISVNTISDIFCGCGTTALEAKKNSLNFWGCDINPVATLIARVKSKQYNKKTLKKYYDDIIASIENNEELIDNEIQYNERINYWFHESQVLDLNILLSSIESVVPKGKYRDFFLVAFSNILKKTSKWLMKSIKPQIDPNKEIYDVKSTFISQFKLMYNANEDAIDNYKSISEIKIETKNFLTYKVNQEFVDMVVTSPPYVTSYEYADLHQLSTLWLEYSNDYKTFRKGTIGSLYHNDSNDIENIPSVGRDIYYKMFKSDKRKAKSVGKYFKDMNEVVSKVYKMINKGGLAIFVIGNTKYLDVEIDNAKFLSSCMLLHGFKEIDVAKRKISSKILSPYRDKNGRFTNNKNDKKVYSHEFILIGIKE
ncbi:MAG TPA: DNA methyltransferase [Mariniflexile sp.]